MRTLSVAVDKLFLQTKAAAEERQGIYFGEGLCLPSHAALTSAGAQGFGLGNGSGEGWWWWSEGGGGTRHVAPRLRVGGGGCCTQEAAWPSRAIWPLTLSPAP